MGHTALALVATVFVLTAAVALIVTIHEWAAWRRQKALNARINDRRPRERG